MSYVKPPEMGAFLHLVLNSFSLPDFAPSVPSFPRPRNANKTNNPNIINKIRRKGGDFDIPNKK